MTGLLDRLAELAEAATPGPWRWEMAKAQMLQREIPLVVSGGNDAIAGRVAPFQAIAETGFDAPETNADLIVAAVNALPALLHLARAAEWVYEAHFQDDDGPFAELRSALASLGDTE